MKKALIYITLFIFGLVAFPVLLFLNWRNKEKSYKNYLIASGIGFAFFILVPTDSVETETETEQVAEVEAENETQEEVAEVEEVSDEDVEEVVEEDIDDEPEFDNVFEEAAHEVFGEQLNSVEVHGETDSRINVSADFSDNLTSGLIRTGMLTNVRDFLKEIQGEEFSEVYISHRGTMVDSYGNENDREAMYAIFTKKTVDNINFDNFDYNNIPEIADDFYIHEAFN